MKDHRYYVLRPKYISHQTFIVIYGDWEHLSEATRERNIDSFSGKDAKAKADKYAADLTTTRSILHTIAAKDSECRSIDAQKLATVLFLIDPEATKERHELEVMVNTLTLRVAKLERLHPESLK